MKFSAILGASTKTPISRLSASGGSADSQLKLEIANVSSPPACTKLARVVRPSHFARLTRGSWVSVGCRILGLVRQDGKTRDLILFAVSVLILPALCVVVQKLLVRPHFRDRLTGAIEAANYWTATATLVCVSGTSFALWKSGGTAAAWLAWSKWIIATLLVVHLAFVLGIAASKRRLAVLAWLLDRGTQVTTFGIAFAVAVLALFQVNFQSPYFIGSIKLFADPPFPGIGLAAVVSVAILAAIFATVTWEAKHPKTLRRAQRAALAAAIALVFLAFFDLSLILDPLHYLTIVGPAVNVLHGATPMVDAFSQYGPGPVAVTLLAFAFGPRTLATAQVTTQVANLLFHGVWLVCLFKMSASKISALLSGIATIAILMAAWDFGKSNINAAPSILGLRYLPSLMMVLALSCLRPPKRAGRFSPHCARAPPAYGAWKA